MKRLLSGVIVLTILLMAIPANAETTNLTGAANLWENMVANDTTVTFTDSVLEKVIRDKIQKPVGPLMQSDIDGVESLEYNGMTGGRGKIKNLTGIEQLRNLQFLSLDYNQISDISSVGLLKNLTSLSLCGNYIEDISPVGDLTNLHTLYLENNKIKDISPVGKLSKLSGFYASDNYISNIEPLAACELLYSLILNDTISKIFILSAR